jgi:hypothetical protein
MKAKLALVLLALTVLSGCTVVFQDHPRPYRSYYWR